MNANKIDYAQHIIDDMMGSNNIKIKRIKKDNGLLERKETEKVILVEDNKQLILG